MLPNQPGPCFHALQSPGRILSAVGLQRLNRRRKLLQQAVLTDGTVTKGRLRQLPAFALQVKKRIAFCQPAHTLL